ncbi:MAG: T9SS type A sorting domain-containing protein [Bacteroidetes bacterium]|nr:T9SS type A sorting domain-containing protein [Bacteroidota bacterium]
MGRVSQLFFCVGFLTINSYTKAQITLSETDFASQGDTVRMSLTDETSTDYISAGEAFTWDFSGLVPTSQFVREFTAIGFSPVQLTFGIFADDDYQSSYFIPETNFPLEQIGDFLPISLSDPRSYQKSTEDSITKVGFSIKVSGIDVAFPSDTIETKYKFPMTYNQVFTTKGYTFIDFSPAADFKIKQLRNITSTVDGYGQLILPFGTFDVLRLKREINEIDSIYQSFFGPPSWFGAPPFQSTEYEWIGQNKKEVLLRIIVSNINGSEQIRVIEYQDNYLGLDAGLNSIDFQVSAFPNPTTDLIQVSSDVIIKNVSLLDATGLILEEQVSVDSQKFSLDLHAYSAGIYFLNVESASGSKIIRVTKN